MLKKISLLLSIVLLVAAGICSASDYTPRPGVLSPEQVDFEGKTVTILVGDLGYMGPYGGEPNPERMAEAEALFNVKIELQHLGTVNVADTIIARIMSGDAALDIIRMPHRYGYYSLVSSNMLMAMNKILPQAYWDSLPRVDRYTIEKLGYAGNFYGFGIVYGLFNPSMMFATYNKDIIERENLPDPYELYLAGEWSYETLTQLAIAATKDTDGDGTPDQFGIDQRMISHDTRIYRLAAANGAEIAKPDENGRWVYTFNQPEAIDVMNQVVDWRYNLKVSGGSFSGGTALFYMQTNLAGTPGGYPNFGLVPIPSFTPGEYKYPAYDFAMNMLPINSAYPEGLIALVDFLFREEDGEINLDYHINTYMKTQDHFNMFMDAIESWQGEGDPFQDMFWRTMQPHVISVIEAEKGAQATMDEIAPQIQAMIDDLFKQK